MADFDLRSSRQLSVEGHPVSILHGVFAVDDSDGTDQLFDVPRGTRIVDGSIAMVTPVTGTSQVGTLRSGSNDIITVADTTASMSTPQGLDIDGQVLVDAAAEETITFVRSSSSGLSAAGSMRVTLVCFREDANA